MNIIGIIMECNPFHNGHLHFINEVKKKYNPDVLVAITTTSFTMRGEISVIDKFTKTNALLNSNVDLVLEFPFILSTQSSDYFAANAITILNDIGVNHIVCGCETTDIKVFDNIYNTESSKDFIELFAKNIKQRASYKITFYETLKQMGLNEELVKIFNMPNFTLAYQYYKIIKNKFQHISFSLVKRTNNYDDTTICGKLSSAKAIREGLLNHQNVDNFVPYKYNYINISDAEDNLLRILKYHYYISKDNKNLYIDKEGIFNYINKDIDNYCSYDNLINSLKNKKYSVARIKRCILYKIMNVSKLIHNYNYLRILGTNIKGLKHINNLDTKIKEIIFSGVNEINELHPSYNILELELLATKLYSMLTNNSSLIKEEYRLPIRKKEK